MIIFEKFGQHQPLNRQAERYAREGVPLSLSTLADQVGACTSALMPLFERLRRHVMAADRLHGDDTTVPVLARGKTDIRSWVYLGAALPLARSFIILTIGLGRTRTRIWQATGILQAEPIADTVPLQIGAPAPILEALCWAHARRFFVLAASTVGKSHAMISPMCLEAVRRIDAVFDIERDINADQRRDMRAACKNLVDDLHAWMTEERKKLSGNNDVAKAWITCSSAGRVSPASLMTVAFASRTTRLNAR